jgi:hypothetical protein
MDPYGFDVAVKKMKLEEYDRKDHPDWTGSNIMPYFQTNVSDNGMDLWPEYMFETKQVYYATMPENDYRGLDEVNYMEQWNKDDHPWKLSSYIDPERRASYMGSGYLLNSHRKMRPHRSWWSCTIPLNLFVPAKLFKVIDDLNKIHNDMEITDFYRIGYVHRQSQYDFDGYLMYNPDSWDIGEIFQRLNNTDFNTVQ